MDEDTFKKIVKKPWNSIETNPNIYDLGSNRLSLEVKH